ncbi:cupin [Halorubellus sp. JP-L1]|uniref:cupin domain-containing protein n=1 Tax=Halorubellus sp. JP-L1 TaxID=2715753 RepID=UPI00140D8303|nr:cupin [Halorubellus sp. JP-L1]NHN42502.1 cupin [Halorubellus sp. JP-L1]
MERATVDPTDDRSDLGVDLGTTDVAVVRYRLAPGEGFPSGLHAHNDQEEAFVVLSGEAVFEHLPPAESWDGAAPAGKEVTVAASEAVRFAPGEFQTGRNPERADRDLVALALGAPRQTADVRIPAACPDCDAPALGLGTGGDAFTLDCPDCERSFEPAPCEACGSHDLGMGLDDDGHPVSRCGDCGHEHETAPLVD